MTSLSRASTVSRTEKEKFGTEYARVNYINMGVICTNGGCWNSVSKVTSYESVYESDSDATAEYVDFQVDCCC